MACPKHWPPKKSRKKFKFIRNDLKLYLERTEVAIVNEHLPNYSFIKSTSKLDENKLTILNFQLQN